LPGPVLPPHVTQWVKEKPSEQREMIAAMVFLGVWMCVGTAGYRILEHWPLLDAFYMSFITLTTIGFSEIHALSAEGRIFTVVFAFVGIGVVAFTAARGAQLLVAGAIIRQRQRARKIRLMRNHYVICGFGRIGQDVTAALVRAGKPVVVVDLSKQRNHSAIDQGYLAVLGDATQESTLRSAGVEHACGLITLLPEDSLNVYVTLVGREINPELFILARAYDLASRKRLVRAGATQAVAPAHVGASRIVQVILKPFVDQFISNVLTVGDLELTIEQIRVTDDSYLAGKTLGELQFRDNFKAVVTCILKAPAMTMLFPPGPDDRIEAGDMLLVLASNEMLGQLSHLGEHADLSALTEPH